MRYVGIVITLDTLYIIVFARKLNVCWSIKTLLLSSKSVAFVFKPDLRTSPHCLKCLASRLSRVGNSDFTLQKAKNNFSLPRFCQYRTALRAISMCLFAMNLSLKDMIERENKVVDALSAHTCHYVVISHVPQESYKAEKYSSHSGILKFLVKRLAIDRNFVCFSSKGIFAVHFTAPKTM